jgi:hypothetical protein
LIGALTRPESVVDLPLRDWDYLLRQARLCGLLARLDALLEARGLVEGLPEVVRRHLESARVIAAKQVRVVRYEVHRIRQALADLCVPIVLLKGAAYIMADLPVGRGRLFHDIDILVPVERLDEVEQLLKLHGWMSTHHSEYDQRYYRQWMHELPPLRHIRRKSVLDVHHTILPLTSRLRPDPRKLFQEARLLEEDLLVLAPADMVLHSATHLFHDGELDSGLRDLLDLDSLLRHFGAEADFWGQLADRARQLDLMRPLYYALRYTRRMLGTPVSEQAWQAVQQGRPMWPSAGLMDALVRHALAPPTPDRAMPGAVFARWLLYVRGHYLRMPLYLLVPHLAHQLMARYSDEGGGTGQPARQG